MRMSLKVFCVSVSLSFGGTALIAEPSLVMPDSDWDFVTAKLLNEGYSVIHLAHDGSNYLNASDRYGSEVMILVEPATHRILSVTPVNPLDE